MKSSETASFSLATLPQVHTIGLMQFDPVWAERMHKNSFAEILYVRGGAMELVFEDSSFSASAGDILFVPPHRLHRDEFDIEKRLEIFYCSFSWELAKKFFRIVDNNSLKSLLPRSRNDIADMFVQISADLAGGRETDMLVTRARILTILLTILHETTLRNMPAAEDDSIAARRRQIFRRAKDYLDLNYAQCISLDHVAEAIDISAYYLSHVFSEESGFSLFTYLTNLRMEKAADLLRAGKLNVSQVADSVGFNDANYFSKVFRKNYNCSPSEFASM